MTQMLLARELPNLRRHRVFESNDIHVTRESIAAVLQPHRLDPHRMERTPHCYLDHIPIAQMGVGAIRFGAAQVEVPEMADYYLFLMCREGRALVTVDGDDYAIGRDRGVILAPGERMVGRFSADCEQLFVRIGRQAMLTHSALRDPRFRRDVALTDPRLAPWLSLVASVIGDEQTGALLREAPRLTQDYERLLLGLFLSAQPHCEARDRPGELAPGCVKRAETYIAETFAEPLTLADIAGAARVSSRALLENFRRFRGVSPMRHLRDVRLDHARRAMLGGAVESAAMAALDAGIMHFGRFSRDYAERFGERPSDTLRRRKHLS